MNVPKVLHLLQMGANSKTLIVMTVKFLQLKTDATNVGAIKAKLYVHLKMIVRMQWLVEDH